MTTPSDIERDLARLDADLRKLEAEYNMFFAGQLPRPPWETRSAVEAFIRRMDRAYIQGYSFRFRFNTLQARFRTFTELWDRALRAREEGRPGPFARRQQAEGAHPKAATRVFHVTTLADVKRDIDKVHELYERLAEARKEAGEPPVPFHRFFQVIREQVGQLRKSGTPEVAFRVMLRNGKVNLTARALKGAARQE
ncbi:MAG: MXAN_5187 C-terminal domain-containing protein [Vicinamibacterales bacterium]